MVLLAGVREYGNPDPLAGLAIHPEELGRCTTTSDPFIAEELPPYLTRGVESSLLISWGPASMIATSLPKRR